MQTAIPVITTPVPRRAAMKITAAALAAALTVPTRACTADTTTLPTLALASPGAAPAAVLLASASTAAQPEGADADLIRLCATYMAIDARIADWEDDRIEIDEAESDRLIEAWGNLRKPIALTPARTYAGVRDKARVAYAASRYIDQVESPILNQLLRSALADVVALGDRA